MVKNTMVLAPLLTLGDNSKIVQGLSNPGWSAIASKFGER